MKKANSIRLRRVPRPPAGEAGVLLVGEGVKRLRRDGTRTTTWRMSRRSRHLAEADYKWYHARLPARQGQSPWGSIFLSFFFGLTIPLNLAAQNPQVLEGSKMVMTLPQSLERSLSNNPRILQAKQEMNIAKTNVSQARSLFFPHVDLNLNYARYRNEVTGITSPELGYAILGPTVGTSGDRNDFSSKNLYLGRFGFKQTLYAGGRLNSTYELSKANLERSNIFYESLIREIEYQVKESFYSLLSCEAKRELMGQSLRELKGLGSKVQGPRDRMALIRAQSEIREKEANLKKEEKQQRFNYLQAVGLELFAEVEIHGTIDIASPSLDLEQALAWAKQNRTELKETQLAEESDRLSVNLAMSERYPVLLLGGAYELRDQTMDLSQNNWNAVLSMNIPIFDGFSGIARIKESRYKAKQGQYRRVQLEDQIEKEVRSAYDDFIFWQEELRNRSEEGRLLVEAGGKSGGQQSLSDRIDFIKWKLESTLKTADAKLNLALARSRLEYSVGRSFSQ